MEKEEVMRRIEVKYFGLTKEELQVIAKKYVLEIKEHSTTCWVSLSVPEADTKITWFN